MSKQGKITIKHYLNDKLKSRIISSGEGFPIYIRVSFLRKNFRFKSPFCRGYYSELALELPHNRKLMEYETEMITFAIRNHENIDDLSHYLSFLTHNVIHFVKHSILSDKKFFHTKIHKLLTNEITNLIVEKTGISKDAVSSFVNINEKIDNSFFTLLDESLIQNDYLRKAVLFIKLLLDFEKNEYKVAGLNFYEWKYKSGKINFLIFLKNKNEDFSKYISLIDKYIDWSESNS